MIEGALRRVPALAPLWSSHPYRNLLAAQYASHVGRWMILLGAQWAVIDAGPGFVALVTTANSLPVLLFALVGGALADTIDRRRILLSTQGSIATIALALLTLSMLGWAAPLQVLGLMFLLGTAIAINTPPWQSVQADIVPRELVAQAATLAAVSANVGRAIGPALGAGAVVVAGLNGVFALSAAVFALALYLTARAGPLGRPHRSNDTFLQALVAVGRYIGTSTLTRRVLLWTAIFVSTNAGLWALMPSVAREQLGLDATGYGLLLGTIGAGAFLGALVMPAARRRWSANTLFAISIVTIGLATVGATALQNVWLVAVLLLAVGTAYIAVIALLNSTLQLMVPAWIRARVLAIFLMTFFATLAAGSAVWGVVASDLGASAAVAISGASLVAAALLLLRFGFPESGANLDAPTARGAPPASEPVGSGPVS